MPPTQSLSHMNKWLHPNFTLACSLSVRYNLLPIEKSVQPISPLPAHQAGCWFFFFNAGHLYKFSHFFHPQVYLSGPKWHAFMASITKRIVRKEFSHYHTCHDKETNNNCMFRVNRAVRKSGQCISRHSQQSGSITALLEAWLSVTKANLNNNLHQEGNFLV